MIDIPKSLAWKNYDLPAVCKEGRRIAKAKRAESLEFVEDFKQCDGSEIFLASGSLQYLGNNIWDMFSHFESVPAHVFITMLPIHDGPEFFTLQNIGTAYCPYRIYDKESFFGEFEKLRYRLIDEWDCPTKSCFIPFHPAHSQSRYHGFYFLRDSA